MRRLVLSALLLSGCWPMNTPQTPDGGAAMAATTQDQCAAIANAYCFQVNQCGVAEPLDQCVQEFVTNCCGNACAVASATPQARITQCINDIQQADCDLLSQQAVPASCNRVVVPQAP